LNFDIELLGNCDTIVSELCRRLGDEWAKLSIGNPLRETVFSESSQSSANSKPLKRSRSAQTALAKRAKVEKQKRRHKADDAGSSSNGTRHSVDVAELRKMYKPRLKNLASELEENTYLFVPPSRNIFSGAEVFTPLDDDDDDESTSSSTSSDTDYPEVKKARELDAST